MSRGVLLQVCRDVGQVVEHLYDSSERDDSVIDRKIEEVELAGLHLQVALSSKVPKGKRYVACAGVGDWVLNLRGSGRGVWACGGRPWLFFPELF